MNKQKQCRCKSNAGILFALEKPEEKLDIFSFKLLRKHPDNKSKYYYQCSICDQVWEKQTQPHPYGYSENWKKLENLPDFSK